MNSLPRDSIRLKLMLVFLPLLLILGIAEGLARFFPHRDSNQTVAGFVIPHPDYIWKLKPFAQGPLRTNELGFRDGPYRVDAKTKILVLGDSVSWGDGVLDSAQLYPSVLEQKLNAILPTTSVEVINSGVPGYSTFQERKYLEAEGLLLKPQLIILQFCLNDVFERFLTVSEFGGDNIFLGVDTRGSAQGIFGLLLRNSRAFEFLLRLTQWSARKSEQYRVSKLASNTLSPELSEAWADTKKELSKVLQIAHDRKIPLVILVTPYAFQLKDPDKLRQPQDQLLQFCTMHNIPCLDLLPAFHAATKGANANLFIDQNHLSVAGHAQVAEALLQPVINQLGQNSLDPNHNF